MEKYRAVRHQVVECRQLHVSSELITCLGWQYQWPHVAQVGELTRTVSAVWAQE